MAPFDRLASKRFGTMILFGMFAKYWEAGEVKTRLAEGIGAEQAAEVYRVFVEVLLRRFQNVGDCRRLVYSPPHRQAEMERLTPPSWQVVPQSAGDLGQRMGSFFTAAFAGGAERVVLIGSDSPLLPLEWVDRAIAELVEHDLVLGPSDDGGYYLVGAARRVPPIFAGVEWSSQYVLRQTLELAGAAGLHYKLLPTCYDVDDRRDLLRLRDELQAHDEFPELREAVHNALR